MTPTYDVIVVGLGATGSAALYHLARRNLRVLAIERFEPGHDRGSSHGQTRIIRHSYFEHPSYVPLVRRAAELWRDLEQRSGKSLMTITGIAEIGRPDSALIKGTLVASHQHALPHEILSAQELMTRYPVFRAPKDYVAVVQPDGGFVEAEAGIAAHVTLALAAGADIRTGEQVTAITQHGSGVRVTSGRGNLDAACVIIAAGAWSKALLPDLQLPLTPTRQVLLWLRPQQPDLFRPDRFPVFLIESDDGLHYGFPWRDNEGLKIAKHHHAGEVVDADVYDRQVSERDQATITQPIQRFLPAIAGPVIAARTCLYTMAPDEDFVIDRVPGSDNIILASPCSGHGFKFAPAIGEALAELAVTGQAAADLSRFSLQRFAAR